MKVCSKKFHKSVQSCQTSTTDQGNKKHNLRVEECIASSCSPLSISFRALLLFFLASCLGSRGKAGISGLLRRFLRLTLIDRRLRPKDSFLHIAFARVVERLMHDTRLYVLILLEQSFCFVNGVRPAGMGRDATPVSIAQLLHFKNSIREGGCCTHNMKPAADSQRTRRAMGIACVYQCPVISRHG